MTDPLTGLADRRQFRDCLAEQLTAGGPDGPGVMLIDLDRFKAVNDALGHPAGDALLQSAARRLRGALRPDDTVARLGGDEFAVLFARPVDRGSMSAIAARLVELLARPYLLRGQVALVGASIGGAIAPEDGTDPDRLMSCADLALYQSKGRGRGCFSFFAPEMQSRADERRRLEIALRAALPRGELALHYQPQVNLHSQALAGFEALLRWNRPGNGLIPPTAFIPLAEETGLIGSIGDWVVREATVEAARWPAPLCVAVNVAPQQFQDGRLVGTVRAALAAAGLPGSRLELEVTESALLEDAGWCTRDQLQALKEMGVRISLDDFGTGYSSLSQLRNFPFDRVKIDRSFADDAAVVRAVALLGASLGMRTTAEGVETPEQLERMRAEGCTEAQGFLLGLPMPPEEAAALIRRSDDLLHKPGEVG
ncbi:putative bifunctional diguanylate cyclase/phosphodiesterase [Roseicella aquatilis]|nr:EAL domain-containing protein [Roseicella aquatilis]